MGLGGEGGSGCKGGRGLVWGCGDLGRSRSICQLSTFNCQLSTFNFKLESWQLKAESWTLQAESWTTESGKLNVGHLIVNRNIWYVDRLKLKVGKLTSARTVQLSTSQLSTSNFQLPTFNLQLPTSNSQVVNWKLNVEPCGSWSRCQLPTLNFQLVLLTILCSTFNFASWKLKADSWTFKVEKLKVAGGVGETTARL